MSFDETAFATKINRLGLKHFGYQELLTRTTWKNKFGTKNSKPPMRLWDNIIPTVIVLDALRAELGKSISLQSVYRSEAYNQASSDSSKGYTGRAKTSQHMAFSAVDFIVSGMACTKVATILLFERKAEKVSAGTIPFGELPRHWHVWPIGVWFSFKGFIKAYPSENFTHLDTRGLTSVMTE